MTRRYNKNDRTAAGKGGYQSPAMLLSHKRYQERKKGNIPPLEYIPIKEAIKVLP